MDSPSYEDVAGEEEQFTSHDVFKLIYKGLSNIRVSLELDISETRVADYKRLYRAMEVQQLGKILLEDGTVIELTQEEHERVVRMIAVSPTNSRKIPVRDYAPFAISDIVTDKAKIAALAQTTLDIDSFPQVEKYKRKEYQDLG